MACASTPAHDEFTRCLDTCNDANNRCAEQCPGAHWVPEQSLLRNGRDYAQFPTPTPRFPDALPPHLLRP